MKKLKFLLMAVIVLLILGLLSQVVQATDETPTMKLNIYTEGEQGPRPFSEDDETLPSDPGHDEYRLVFGDDLYDKPIFKIGEIADGSNLLPTPPSSTLNFDKILYCLRFELGFGNGEVPEGVLEGGLEYSFKRKF